MLKEFVPPTIEQVAEYIREKGYDVDAKTFFDYFTEGDWIDSEGKKVRNWKQKIITWDNLGRRGPKSNKTKLFPIRGRICGKDKCRLPAVYKDSTGGYDHYYCHLHMPEKVKELYK